MDKGKEVCDIEARRLRAVEVDLIPGQHQIVNHITRSEVLLLIPQCQLTEVAYGAT